MVTSVTGLSYSIIVLFLEVSNFSNLVIPMVVCVFISRGLTSMLSRSTYNCELRQQQYPYLQREVPQAAQKFTAGEIMSKNLITVPSIAEMRIIKNAIDSEHQAFPVLNTAGHLIGLLPKVVLNELLKQKLFYDSSRLSTSFKQKSPALNPDEDQQE
jgi:chloride channel 7